MQTLQTRYFGPTNTQGAKVQAKTSGGIGLVRSYDYELCPMENHLQIARELKAELGWDEPMIGTDVGDGYLFIFCELKID